MTTEELIRAIEDRGCVLYGTGYVAGLFLRALAARGLENRVRCCLVTKKEPGADAFCGHPVYAFAQAEMPAPEEAPILCICVHETVLSAIRAQAEARWPGPVVWAYPHIFPLFFGEGRYVEYMSPWRLALCQGAGDHWLAERYAALREHLEEPQAHRAGDLYVKLQSAFTKADTAKKRLERFYELEKSYGAKGGFDPACPLLVDEKGRVIDGLHRLALALYHEEALIPCRVAAANRWYTVLFDERVRVNTKAMERLNLTQEEKALLTGTWRALRRRARREAGGAAPAISVIVPVYNIGAYLEECMESLARQTFADFEVLLINDGSTDDSPLRCLAWAGKEKRVRFIDKPNEGVAASRNLGIELARGEYLAFVDPDDWLEDTYLEKLYAAAESEGADFAECDLWRYDNRTGKKIYRACYGRMGRPYTLPEHMKYGPTATYKAISKKSLWVKHGVRMPDCSFESPAVYALVLALAGKVASVREPLYYYRRFRENSLIENGYAAPDGAPNNTLAIEAMEYLTEGFRKNGLYEQFRDVLPGVVCYRLSDILAMQYHRKSGADFRSLVENYRAFLKRAFPGLNHARYVTVGGYNLNRILTHMNLLHDPSCRFNFSSLAAACAPGPEGVIPPVEHRNRYRRMMIERELRRELADVLTREQPRYCFLDLIEERHDLCGLEGALCTLSDAFEGSSLAALPARRIPRQSPECEQLFRAGVKRLIELAKACAPGLRFVVVENYLSERVGDLQTQIPFDDLPGIRRTNALLSGYYAYLKEQLPDAVWIAPAGDELYFTDRAYEYGAVPSHLNEIENERIAKRIEESLT